MFLVNIAVRESHKIGFSSFFRCRTWVNFIYDIINRGVERKNIFLQSEDYEKFLEILKKIQESANITIHSYCLMTNHYHLLIETHSENISAAMQYLNSNYSIYFNKKYHRTGHLWQGRFHSYYLYDDRHFWIVAKYIERNPIVANMVKEIKQYKYQSFFQWKYKSENYELLKNSMIFDMTLNEYEGFISSAMVTDILEQVYSSPKFVKKDGNFKILYKRLETFFDEDRDFNRNENIKKAYDYGYSQTEISNFIKLDRKTISQIVKERKNKNRE